MSLNNNLIEVIDKVIEKFISTVSNKYNLDSNELKFMWNGKDIKSKDVDKKVTEESTVDKKVTVDTTVDPEHLLRCNKAELVAMCKSFSYKCSGTKSELMARLVGKEEKKEKKKGTDPAKTPVIKKLTANIPNILIRRNKFNNYEHPESGLVFDNQEKIVIGKQNDDGNIDDLTEEDIDKCNAFKFRYKIPDNLDGKSTLDNVKVEELDDEDSDNEELVNEESEEEEIELEISEDDEEVEYEYEDV